MSSTVFARKVQAPDNQSLGEMFEQLCQHAPHAPARGPVIKVIISMLHSSGVLGRWTHGIAGRYHINRDSLEDIAQVIALAVLERLKKITTDDLVTINSLYLQHMHQVGKSAVIAHLGSGENTGMSGTSGVVRRQTALAVARRALVAEGVANPSNAQVMERANETAQMRKNQKKQGMVFSESDLVSAIPNVGTIEEVQEPTQDQYEDADLKFEMTQAVRALVAHIGMRHPENTELRVFALSWVRHTYEGIKPTFERIAEDTGLPVDTLPQLSRKFRHEMTRFREAQR